MRSWFRRQLDVMLVNFKKAILENSKEFLLKSLGYKEKRGYILFILKSHLMTYNILINSNF